MRALFACLLLALAALASPALAQLPGVQLPTLPAAVPGVIDETRDTLRTTTRELTRVRRDLVRGLLRRHRAELERDPQGAPIRRGEILAWAPSEAALAEAQRAGFRVVRRDELEGLDVALYVLAPPERLSTRRGLEALRALDPEGAYDFNHLYQQSGQSNAPGGRGPPAGDGVRVGLIDGGVDEGHPAFSGARITARGFYGNARASPHGTAVASLLIGRGAGLSSAAPGAHLYAADVYCGSEIGGGADSVAQALAWMARERVGVVNISLVGPANRTIEAAVRAMNARGHLLVAAVGNDGPAAPALYPASYPGVVGVTGVDGRRALIEAARGTQVDFAAQGASLRAAAPGGRYSSVRGTSYASPIVAGMLARELPSPSLEGAARALERLRARAADLGERGADRTFGAGLISL
ncbi:MAG: S8 family serine peptidase [Hyphomonadaceae bacterium]